MIKSNNPDRDLSGIEISQIRNVTHIKVPTAESIHGSVVIKGDEMNIKDVRETEEYPENLLEDIFARQLELVKKYSEIEGHPVWPVPESEFDQRETQRYIKDFAWRTVEELAEMVHAENESADKLHGLEELGDATHFLVEMSMITNYDYNRLSVHDHEPLACTFDQARRWIMNQIAYPPFDSRDRMAILHQFIIELGWSCNFLKAKMWKITPMLSDWEAYHNQLDMVWVHFAAIAISRGIDEFGLYDLYRRKSIVNTWRQKSDY